MMTGRTLVGYLHLIYIYIYDIIEDTVLASFEAAVEPMLYIVVRSKQPLSRLQALYPQAPQLSFLGFWVYSCLTDSKTFVEIGFEKCSI